MGAPPPPMPPASPWPAPVPSSQKPSVDRAVDGEFSHYPSGGVVGGRQGIIIGTPPERPSSGRSQMHDAATAQLRPSLVVDSTRGAEADAWARETLLKLQLEQFD